MTPKATLKSDFEQLNPTTWRLSVTVPPERSRKAVDAVYRELGKNADIPGFRPGKAPRNIINRHYGGKARIMQEAVGEVVQSTIWGLIKDKELSLIGQPRIDNDDFAEGSDFNYTAIFETIPSVPEIDYDEIKVKLPERKIDEEMLADEIRRLKLRLGESTEITDRPSENGDFAVVAFEGVVPDVMVDALEGEKPWKVVDEYMEVELGANRGIEGLDEHLIGMELEEIKEFDLKLPDDFNDKRVRGKTLNVKARLTGLRRLEPAELTDEFVTERFGEQGVTNEKDLEEKIKLEIENNFTRMDANAKSEQLELILEEMIDLPVPEGLVRTKFADILDRSLQQLKDQDKNIEELMEEGNEIGERIRKRARFQAERLVKLDLILREVGRKENIVVQNEEVANYLMFLGMQQGVKEADLKALLRDAQFVETTRDELLRKKVTNFLLSKIEEERVSEDEFKDLVDDARDSNEERQNRFIEESEDPLIALQVDYFDQVIRDADSATGSETSDADAEDDSGNGSDEAEAGESDD